GRRAGRWCGSTGRRCPPGLDLGGLRRRTAKAVRAAIPDRCCGGRSTVKPLVTDQSFNEWLESLYRQPTPVPLLVEVGRVVEVADGIAVVGDLKHARADELLIFSSGVHGLVLDLEPGRLGVILLGPGE